MFGLIEELVFKILEGFERGGILGKFAGEGVERLFGGVAAGEKKFFVLQIQGAFGTVLFTGAEKERGVAGKIGGFDFTAGDLTKGFLTESGKDRLGNLAGAAADQGDEGVGFLGGAVDAAGPAFVGVFGEEGVDVAFGGGGESGVVEAEVDGVVIGAFAEPDEDVLLNVLREGVEGVGRVGRGDFQIGNRGQLREGGRGLGGFHSGWESARPDGVRRHSVRRESGSTRKSR